MCIDSVVVVVVGVVIEEGVGFVFVFVVYCNIVDSMIDRKIVVLFTNIRGDIVYKYSNDTDFPYYMYMHILCILYMYRYLYCVYQIVYRCTSTGMCESNTTHIKLKHTHQLIIL